MKMTDEIRAHTKALLVPDKYKGVRRTKRVPTKMGHNYGLWCRPYASDALGVNPEQIQEAKAGARAHGVDVDFDKEGRAIIKSDKHFKDVARATGMYDGGTGYETKGDDGFKQTSGRTPVQERERLKKQIEEWE